MKLVTPWFTAALIALALALAAFFLQRKVLFPAPWDAVPPPARPAEVIRLEQPNGAVEAIFLPPSTEPAGGPAPLFLFMHGNGELADYSIEEFAEPRRWGWAALLVEYPGYGRSAGRPSEAAIHAAVRAAYDWAARDPRVDASRIVAYGRSLGGGAAARFAADRPVAGLILESSFTSVRPLAARYLLPGFMVRDPFDNLAALTRYRGPALVLHGTDDDIIPVSHGRALAAAIPGAEFHELPCGHNDCARSWGLVRAFLTSNRLM
jgi:uncharacterized protein